MAVFGAIAGAILLSGPIAITASGVLFATAVKGGYDLYIYWPEMDTVDRSIAIAIIATYSTFGLAIRPARGVPSAYEGQASVIPESYFGKISIDMQRAPTSSSLTKFGFPRNSRWFWGEVLRERPEWFSQANKGRISSQQGRSISPLVDSMWIRYHPEHAAFMGDVLVHHHMAQGRYAVPLPEIVHRAYSNTLHSN